MDFPISEGTLLQQVAEESGAARRFSKMDAYVLRMGENGRRFQMKARWDRGDRQFSLDTDYAIQPGDRVVFMEDGSSMVGNVIDTVLGPLAGGG